MNNIGELVRKAEQDDKAGVTQIGKYVSFNQRETLETIDAYLNSKHISGSQDSQGREKPFFNIVTAAANIWFRATDIDRNQINIKASKQSDAVKAFLATIFTQEWMRKEYFGQFLNQWGLTLARYGSAVCKFVEKDDELHPEVVPWNRLIVDPVDFENNPKIEKLWFTPAQLLKSNYDQEYVKKLIDALESRETLEGQDKDNKDEYIPVYEVHGNMPLSYLTGEREDEDEYQEQMHVVSFVEKKEGTDEYDDYTLYSGKESKCPYIITHLLPEDGRTLARGAVENLFEAQWMTNHTAKTIKDQLDLASKLIFQTSDGNFVGQSALSSIENGDILVHRMNEPLTPVNNQATDIAALQSFHEQWKTQANEIVGVSEAMLGAQPKSGTAWRQTEALLMESHSLFETMTENKGLYLKQMMREFIIPHIKKKMDTSEEISAKLEDHQINQIDSMYLPNEVTERVNQKMIDAVLSGEAFYREDQEDEIQIQTDSLRSMLDSLANMRYIKPSQVGDKTWKSVMEDLEWDVEIDITGEAKDRQAVLTTLNNVFSTIASAPQVLQDPNMKLVFNKILNQVGGINPIELSTAQAASRQQQKEQQAQQQIEAPGATGGGQQATGGMVGAGAQQ
jgi:hypothetical protein